MVKDEQLRSKVAAMETDAVRPSAKDEWMLKALLTAREKLMSPSLYWNALSFYRWLSRKNIVIGSSGKGELESVSMPAGYFKGMGKVYTVRQHHYYQNACRKHP